MKTGEREEKKKVWREGGDGEDVMDRVSAGVKVERGKRSVIG